MKYLYFLIVFLSAAIINRDRVQTDDFLRTKRAELVVWNVGQGQWVSLISPKKCEHFDVGGEKNPIQLVAQSCAQKKNLIYLSHWDNDHFRFLKSVLSKFKNSCLGKLPSGKIPWELKELIDKTPPCQKDSDGPLETENFREKPLLIYSGHEKNKSSNEDNMRSLVYLYHQILIPGDSPKSEEKKWAENSNLSQVRGLILGHHGSRTSTSEGLLRHLPHLVWAVSTARQKKYGHPHSEVISRLAQNKIILLRTEDWNHIRFQLQ